MEKIEYYKLNKAGRKLFNEWDRKYRAELARLQKELNDPEYTEGWCIIDNYDYVKTVSDEVGLLVFGYDDNLMAMFDEWREMFTDDYVFLIDEYGVGYKIGEVEELARKYFVKKVTWE